MKHKGAIVQRVSISRSKRGAVNIVRADKTKSAHFKVTLLDISASFQCLLRVRRIKIQARAVLLLTHYVCFIVKARFKIIKQAANRLAWHINLLMLLVLVISCNLIFSDVLTFKE